MRPLQNLRHGCLTDIPTCRECGGAARISEGGVPGLQQDEQEGRAAEDLQRRRQ